MGAARGRPGGGASCLGLGRPGSGALPPPTARPLGGLPGPTTHWLWVRGVAGVGTRHQPHRARSCELALRAVGAARGRPGGVPLAWVWGVRGRALSQARLPALWAGCRGPLPTGCGCGGVRAGGPVTNPTARALSSWLCALWGRHEGAWGGAPPAWVWGVRCRALPHPRLPALWADCRGPLPTGCGCGGVQAWGPITNPTTRALASWLCALWGRHEGARGGRLLPGCGASGVSRSPTPHCPPSGRAAGAHYPLAVGAGGGGRGDPSPTPQRALLRAGFARCGGGHEGARGGAPCLGVGPPGSGALPPPTARPLDGLPGPTTHWLWVRGGAGVGTRHQPHSARSFELALRAVGAARGRPGGRLLPGCGASGAGRSPTPHCPPSGRAAGAHYPLAVGAGGVRAWGPVTNPSAGAPASWLCALWGRHDGAQGGRLLPGCGASGVGRSPTPDCPPSGRAAGAHYPLAPGAGGCGRGDPSPTPQRALLRDGFARCGGGMTVPGGGSSCLGVGRPGSGALPPPTARPSGGLPGCCVCACPAWPGRAGRPPGRVLVRLTFPLAFLASLFACSAPSGLGLPCLCLLLGFLCFFLLLFPFSPLLRPRCVLLCAFSGPGCPGPWRLVPPPLFFLIPSPPSVRPVVSCFACFPAWGALGLGVLLPPPPFVFCFLPPPPPCCLWRFLLSGCLWPLRPPTPFFFSSCCFFFFTAARLLCVFWAAVLCVPCPARSLCCARRLCCFWWPVLLVPGVTAFCWGSAGGSGCPALSFGGVCRLWCPCLVWPSLGVLPVVSRSPVLCPVVLCCRVVLCCGALSSFFFFFLPAGGAGVLLFPAGSGLRAGSGSFLFLRSACAVLCWCACAVALCSVLSCPRGAGWCFVL